VDKKTMTKVSQQKPGADALGVSLFTPSNDRREVGWRTGQEWEAIMGLGCGALLWILGIPLPIITLLALF
jgi:hypothetical protein